MKYNPLVLNGTGWLLLLFGIATVVHPELFTLLYGVLLPTGDAVAAIRAIIGGSEVALGLVFLLRKRLGFSDRSLLILGCAIFSAIVCARIYHLVSDGALTMRFYRELTAEFFITALYIVALKRNS